MKTTLALARLLLMANTTAAQQPDVVSLMSVVMPVKGGKEVPLGPGQTFYETGPTMVHVVGRNASNTKLAKFLVMLIKKQGAPAFVAVN